MDAPSPKLVWVYTDVVGDLFHHGHVEFFRRARALGDRLIVGVDADDMVTTYKPAPILSFAERLAVIRECRYVDRVVEHPAPLCTPEFLDALGADFCVHADDMDAAELHRWYAPVIAAGRFKTVPYTAGISSREIVSRIIARAKAGTLREML